ncbi:hypothetical protein LguiB_027037 [Lonicera macranthoides]
MSQIFTARIKAKGNNSGFIPAEIDMSIGAENFTIKLKARSRLNMARGSSHCSFVELDDFYRCQIDLAGEDDGARKEEFEVEHSRIEIQGSLELEREGTASGRKCAAKGEAQEGDAVINEEPISSLKGKNSYFNQAMVKVKEKIFNLEKRLNDQWVHVASKFTKPQTCFEVQ